MRHLEEVDGPVEVLFGDYCLEWLITGIGGKAFGPDVELHAETLCLLRNHKKLIAPRVTSARLESDVMRLGGRLIRMIRSNGARDRSFLSARNIVVASTDILDSHLTAVPMAFSHAHTSIRDYVCD